MTIVAMLLLACTDELSSDFGDVNISPKTNPATVSPEEAGQTFLDFLAEYDKNVNPKSRNGETPNRKIASIEAVTNLFSESRSANPNPPSDTICYLVNLSDSAGFAIISAHLTQEPVYAFVENENISLETLRNERNQGFLLFMSYVGDMEAINADGSSVGNTTALPIDTIIDGWGVYEYYPAILNTKWDQGSVDEPNSYGRYCPNKVTGCTVTAVAQCLSYYRTIGHVDWSYNEEYGSSDLNWYKIHLDCEIYEGKLNTDKTEKSLNQIAHLCRFLGVSFNAKYKVEKNPKDNHTSVSRDDAIRWLNKWGGINASKSKKYNENTIISNIKSGNPVLVFGKRGRHNYIFFSTYYGGHTWVCDGYMYASKNGKKHHLLHCNWGYDGERDGYYSSGVFNATAGALIPDEGSEADYDATKNYRYKIEYSALSKQ